MMKNSINELMERLKERTFQYAQEQGVLLNDSGFTQCLFPDHDDHDPSMHYWEENNIFYCFGCLAPNEKVFTLQQGFIPIKDVKKDMTTFGKNGQLNDIMVVNKIDGSNKKLYAIKTGLGTRVLQATEDHIQMIIEPRQIKHLRKNSDGSFYYDKRLPLVDTANQSIKLIERKTSELKGNEFLFIPKIQVNKKNKNLKIDSVLAKDIGRYIGVKLLNKNDKRISLDKHLIESYIGDNFIKAYHLLSIDYDLQKEILEGLYEVAGSKRLSYKTTLDLTKSKQLFELVKLMLVNIEEYFWTEDYDATDRLPAKYVIYFKECKDNRKLMYETLKDGTRGAIISIEQIKDIESEPIVYDITTRDSTFLTTVGLTHNCGKAADIFTLAHIFEGKPLAGPDFIEENVFYLAQKYGESYEHLRKEMSPEEIEKQNYYRTMKMFSDYVTSNPNKAFLQSRNISEETAKKINIGSVKNYEDCINYLLKAGCQKNIILNIGIHNYRVNEDQMIFIIKDRFGRPVSFVSRNMNYVKGSNFPKYNNGLESVIFNKSEIFYCWPDIKKKYNSLEPLLIVEGYIDAVTAYNKGYTNVVALGSASFTNEHIKLIEKENRINSVAIALDNDVTGKKRMNSLVSRLKENKTVKEYKFAVYKYDSKDLDEILNQFPEKIPLNEIYDFLSMFDFEIKNLKESLGQDLNESMFFDRFVGIISKTESPKEREEQARALAKYLTQYSYKTILDEVDYLVSGESIRYKNEIESCVQRGFDEISAHPDYTMEILDNVKNDVEDINKKYKKTTKNIFEKGLEDLNKFEQEKMNADLFKLDFGIPWLNDLFLLPGKFLVLTALANVGKFV